MFTLVIGVKPIKVRFLNRFLRLSDKRLLTILIKKKVEEDKSEGAFLTAQNCIFFGFLKMIVFQALNHAPLQKVEYLLNESSDLYEI